MTETEIPEDIMQAAHAVYEDGLADGFRSGSVKIIARALLAERRRHTVEAQPVGYVREPGLRSLAEGNHTSVYPTPNENHGYTIPVYLAAPTPPSRAEVTVEWISVTDKLPGEQGCDSEDVLCFLNGHCGIHDRECRQGGGWGIRLGFYDAERQCFRTGGRPTMEVTHWMPLPAGPALGAGKKEGE